jgi:hypothetical protein
MITKEKLEHHISHLQEKHDAIDKEIIDMEEHHIDRLKIETLKKVKLNIKDDIEKFKVQLNSL